MWLLLLLLLLHQLLLLLLMFGSTIQRAVWLKNLKFAVVVG